MDSQQNSHELEKLKDVTVCDEQADASTAENSPADSFCKAPHVAQVKPKPKR